MFRLGNSYSILLCTSEINAICISGIDGSHFNPLIYFLLLK